MQIMTEPAGARFLAAAARSSARGQRSHGGSIVLELGTACLRQNGLEPSSPRPQVLANASGLFSDGNPQLRP